MFSMAHVGIIVSEIQRSVDFYEKAFGCEVCGTHEDERLKIVYLRAGEGVIELLEYKNTDPSRESKGRVDHIALYVPDMEKAIEKAKSLGAKLSFDAPRPFEDTRIFFIEGPDGERIEFVEKK